MTKYLIMTKYDDYSQSNRMHQSEGLVVTERHHLLIAAKLVGWPIVEVNHLFDFESYNDDGWYLGVRISGKIPLLGFVDQVLPSRELVCGPCKITSGLAEQMREINNDN